MKRVLMFAGPLHSIPSHKGAAVEVWVNEVSQRVITYEIHVASIGSNYLPNSEFSNGTYYHRFQFSRLHKKAFRKYLGWDIYSYNRHIINIIKKVQPDIVHIHNYSNAGGVIDWIRLRRSETKIIYHMHNKTEKNNIRENISKADLFVTCSQFLLDDYAELLNDKSCAQVIYNGVNIEEFSWACTKRSMIRNRLTPDKVNIAFFGRISREKGLEKVVEIAELFKNDDRFMFYCIGQIGKEGGAYKYYQQLKRDVENKGLRNIKFLDCVPPQKIHLAYQLADLLIVPSRFEEPFSMVAIEAMASKIPIVCANRGGMKEYLEDEINAIVIDDYDNFSSIAKDQVLNLFDEMKPEKKVKLIDNAYSIVSSKFDWLKISSHTETTYDQLIGKA